MDFTKLEHSLVLGVKVRSSDIGAAASERAAFTADVSKRNLVRVATYPAAIPAESRKQI
jgi:hypothetical protein